MENEGIEQEMKVIWLLTLFKYLVRREEEILVSQGIRLNIFTSNLVDRNR